MNKGILYAIGANILWGMLPVYWKWVNHVPAAQVLCHRILWSFITLSLVILVFGRDRWPGRLIFKKGVLGTYAAASVFISINWLIYIWAVGAGFIVETSLGYFIHPLLSVLLGVIFFRERLRPLQIFSIVLAGSGVIYLAFSYGSLPWISLGLAVSFSLYGLMKKTAPLGSLNGLSLETAILLVPALAFLLHSNQTGTGAFLHAGAQTSLLLAGAGLVTVAPLLLFSSAARRIRLSVIGLLQYIAPSLQFLTGVFIYHEPFTREKLIGFIIVWLALIIYAAEGLLTARTRTLPVPLE